jgi:hypothetical protein
MAAADDNATVGVSITALVVLVVLIALVTL